MREFAAPLKDLKWVQISEVLLPSPWVDVYKTFTIQLSCTATWKNTAKTSTTTATPSCFPLKLSHEASQVYRSRNLIYVAQS